VPPRLRKPQLPDGPCRRFVDHLWVIYNLADYPALQTVSARIRSLEGLAGTASHETIRRVMSRGDVPRHWATVEAIYVALCSMAHPEIDPDAHEDDGEGHYGFRDSEPPETGRDITRRLWREAYEAQDEVPVRAGPIDLGGGRRMPVGAADEPLF
jgi:hypothetical protein